MGTHIPYRLRNAIALLNGVPLSSQDSVVYPRYEPSGQVGGHHKPAQLGCEAGRHPRRELSTRVGVLDAQYLALGVGARDQVTARVRNHHVNLMAKPG